MATMNGIIEKVSRLKPNAVDDRDIAAWIAELDARLMLELDAPEKMAKEWPEDGDEQLMADEPYDELYAFYAVAMIEFYQRAYSNYNNTLAMFNDRVADFRRYYRRTHRPTNSTPWEGTM